jgi:hypothetical protein
MIPDLPPAVPHHFSRSAMGGDLAPVETPLDMALKRFNTQSMLKKINTGAHDGPGGFTTP